MVLGLLFTADLATENWNGLLTAAASFLGAATVPLGAALWPRNYRFNPNIAALERLAMGWPEEATNRAVVASIRQAIGHNQPILKRKARAVQVGATMIVVGVLLAGARLVYAAESVNGKDSNVPAKHR